MEAGLKKHLNIFRQASEIDPEFSLAYSGMADAYSILSFYGAIPPKDAMPIARQNAEKAIQSDPFNAEAYTALAFISVFYDWNWTEAKKDFNVSLRSIPTMHRLIIGIATIYRLWKGNSKKALRRQKKSWSI